jgi:low temperature requirement protein LtrA
VVGGLRVHWLELFFDLVMVAYIGQVAHGMHGDPGWSDALVFFVLFAPAWWAWVNMTLTLNLFGARITAALGRGHRRDARNRSDGGRGSRGAHR